MEISTENINWIVSAGVGVITSVIGAFIYQMSQKFITANSEKRNVRLNQVRWQGALPLMYSQLNNRHRQLREQASRNLTLRMVDTESKITGV